MQKCTQVGVSFTNDILMKMDAQRGLIPRSVFLRKILEQAYASNQVNENTIPQIRPQVGPHRESVIPTTKGAVDPNG